MSSVNQPQDQLTLFETSRLILAQLERQTALAQESLAIQRSCLEAVSELKYLINGFTSGGASLTGYMPDSFVAAYVGILGPALSQHFSSSDMGLEELMKGGCLMARRLLEELSAYRSEQEGLDVMREALANLNDPWQQGDSSPAS